MARPLSAALALLACMPAVCGAAANTNGGSTRCPCVDTAKARLAAADSFGVLGAVGGAADADADAPCDMVRVEANGARTCYPASYGSGECKAHDSEHTPECKAGGDAAGGWVRVGALACKRVSVPAGGTHRPHTSPAHVVPR